MDQLPWCSRWVGTEGFQEVKGLDLLRQQVK